MTATLDSVKRPVPAPPRHLLDAISNAARDGNATAEAAHIASYHEWLRANGYEIAPGTHTPDKAWT